MSELWRRGSRLGDERLDERADLVLAQVVASHSLVLNRLGGDRAGAVAAADIDHVERLSRSREGRTARQQTPWPKGSLACLASVVARRGGWNGYYRPPGPKTMAHGWDRLAAMLAGMRLCEDGRDV